MGSLPSASERLRAIVEGDREVWQPPTPRRAATVALLRDSPGGLSVYLLRRSATMAAAPEMHVFPGGGVARIDGPLDDPMTTRVAAVRELAEETGVHLPDDWDPMIRFSRWITPEVLPHRHDTDFFATALPPDQEPQLVGTEASSAEWLRPAQALAQADAGQIGLLPPTWAALFLLNRFQSVAAALSGLRGRRVLPLMPAPIRTEDGFGWELRDCDRQRVITDPSEAGLPRDWRPVPPMGGPR